MVVCKILLVVVLCRGGVSNVDVDNEIQSSIMDGDASCGWDICLSPPAPIKGGGGGGVGDELYIFLHSIKPWIGLEVVCLKHAFIKSSGSLVYFLSKKIDFYKNSWFWNVSLPGHSASGLQKARNGWYVYLSKDLSVTTLCTHKSLTQLKMKRKIPTQSRRLFAWSLHFNARPSGLFDLFSNFCFENL